MGNVFSLITKNILVSAQPEYMEAESSSADSQYVWIYHIKIENKGNQAVQLLSRHWHITDGKGLVQEVNGPGVIGVQPTILPDENFEYTSSVSLTTPTGLMHGNYKLRDSSGEMFDIQIPVFSLDSAEQLRMPN